MKRLILFMALTVLWSCKKGGDDVVPAFDPALLAGSWKLTGFTVDPPEANVFDQPMSDFLAGYRQEIGDECIDTFRLNFSADGKISRTTIPKCASRTLELFGFAENGTWKASGSNLTVQSPYASGNYYNVTIDATTMVWHRHVDLNDSADKKTHEATITWSR